ncbi:VanZ family protein [Streptomyces monomycini]|uniref:VanZ family protein n=1 Tax=Streptomyces monomycini TaxID=371720 RepID=UPI0012FE9040|nr:VanZ family protein [Streptomyces monomycini]
MIEASVGAVPGLVPAFVIIALLLAVPVGLIAKLRGRSVVLPTLFTMALAGVLTVTLMPSSLGSEAPGTCDQGLPGAAFLASESAQLNILLFVPLCFLAVLLFRRPVLVLAGTVILTSAIELAQGHLTLGRTCSYDDIKANALGGIIGLSLGCLSLCLFPGRRRRRSPFTRRDTLWGSGAVIVSACAVATAFPATLTIEDHEATTYRSRAELGSTAAMQEWFAGTVTELLGEQANGTTEMRKPQDGQRRWVLRADTSRGSVVATWPDRKLVELRTVSHQHAADASSRSLPDTETRKSAERFARTWFPKETADAEARFEHPRNDPHTRLLSYRRYDHGVMTPMRLDIAVSTTGRITGLTTKVL